MRGRAAWWRVGLGLTLGGLVGCCSSSPEALASPDPDDRREALACLAGDDPDQALDYAGTLIRAGGEPDAALRATAIRVLGVLDGRAWSDAVEVALVGGDDARRDPNPRVRQEAATALGQLGVGVDALARSVLEDPDPEVRWSAADALAHGGPSTPTRVEALIGALDDASQPVRLTARRSLRQLTQTDQGSNPGAWRTWLQEQEPFAEPLPEPEVYEDEAPSLDEGEVYEDEVAPYPEQDPPPADEPR